MKGPKFAGVRASRRKGALPFARSMLRVRRNKRISFLGLALAHVCSAPEKRLRQRHLPHVSCSSSPPSFKTVWAFLEVSDVDLLKAEFTEDDIVEIERALAEFTFGTDVRGTESAHMG